MKGLLADINVIGQIEYLVQRMQADPWDFFWHELALVLKHFEDVGLELRSSDAEIWQICQAEELVLVTNNRNRNGPDSLEDTIRQYNTPESLPVFTIGDLGKFSNNRSYADRVLDRLYSYLVQIDNLRGTGRLFLP